MCHFRYQIIGGYAAFLYEIGLLDEQQKRHFQKQCGKCIDYIKKQDWMKAFEVSSGAPRLTLSNENHLRRGGVRMHSVVLQLLGLCLFPPLPMIRR